MTDYPVGELLRDMRTQDGLRQTDVASALRISRSSLANIEAGRQMLTVEMRERIGKVYPAWESALATGRFVASPHNVNSSFAIDHLTIAYVFEESRSPSEIIQIRRVRALRAGATRYALGMRRTDGEELTSETHVLWGGFLDESLINDAQHVVTTVNFGQPLRLGQPHEFALRSWIERDADPDTAIVLNVTRPTERAELHLTFTGRRAASSAWCYGPVAPGVAERQLHDPGVNALDAGPDGAVTATFTQLRPGMEYWLHWKW